MADQQATAVNGRVPRVGGRRSWHDMTIVPRQDLVREDALQSLASTSEPCCRIVKSEDVRATCGPDARCASDVALEATRGQLHSPRIFKSIIINRLHSQCDWSDREDLLA